MHKTDMQYVALPRKITSGFSYACPTCRAAGLDVDWSRTALESLDALQYLHKEGDISGAAASRQRGFIVLVAISWVRLVRVNFSPSSQASRSLLLHSCFHTNHFSNHFQSLLHPFLDWQAAEGKRSLTCSDDEEVRGTEWIFAVHRGRIAGAVKGLKKDLLLPVETDGERFVLYFKHLGCTRWTFRILGLTRYMAAKVASPVCSQFTVAKREVTIIFGNQ